MNQVKTKFPVLDEIMKATNLKHLLNVVVFGLEQLAPGGQVAISEDAAWFQQPVSVTLQRNTQTNKSWCGLKNTERLQYVYQMKHDVIFRLQSFTFFSDIFYQYSASLNESTCHTNKEWFLQKMCNSLCFRLYLDKVKLVSVPCILGQRVCVIQNTWRGETQC